MPKSHQKHAEWTPTRIVKWAESIGPATGKLAEAILVERPHPEQGYRSCLGILRLSKRYGQERLEAACARAMAAGARSYRHVDSILKHGLDRIAPAEESESRQLSSTTSQSGPPLPSPGPSTRNSGDIGTGVPSATALRAASR
jgi:transposase